ncbi:MAG: PEGA domain-containing protein [Candidatus Saccharimonadales bacterium]
MYYDWIQQHKRTIIICTAALCIIVTVWGIATYISRIGKVGITISAVPSSAVVTINGTPVGNGTHWVAPDTYTIAASKDGFGSRSKQVNVTDAKTHNVVALSLSPQSGAAKQWAERHERDYKQNEAYGAIEARTNGDYFKQKNPITNILPYTDPYYEIAYTTHGSAIVVTISTPSPRYRYIAVQKLRELGFNPSAFTIQFIDFDNPLERAEESDE